ncbi:MAG: hypothetical protein HY807_11595 [Nitrospirae bacterium]|nr:hypothetical protein [Nitrospirota bacterium]
MMTEETSADKTRREVSEVIKSLQWLMDKHDGYFALGDINGDEAAIHCSGVCTTCDTKCIEEAIKEKLPHLKIIFR